MDTNASNNQPDIQSQQAVSMSAVTDQPYVASIVEESITENNCPYALAVPIGEGSTADEGAISTIDPENLGFLAFPFIGSITSDDGCPYALLTGDSRLVNEGRTPSQRSNSSSQEFLPEATELPAEYNLSRDTHSESQSSECYSWFLNSICCCASTTVAFTGASLCCLTLYALGSTTLTFSKVIAADKFGAALTCCGSEKVLQNAVYESLHHEFSKSCASFFATTAAGACCAAGPVIGAEVACRVFGSDR